MSEYEKADQADLVFDPNDNLPTFLSGVVVMSTVVDGEKYLLFKADNLTPAYKVARLIDQFRDGYVAFSTKSPSFGIAVIINNAVFKLGLDFARNLFIFMIAVDSLIDRGTNLIINLSGVFLREKAEEFILNEIGEKVYREFITECSKNKVQVLIRDQWICF